jgi:hypothetical protein
MALSSVFGFASDVRFERRDFPVYGAVLMWAFVVTRVHAIFVRAYTRPAAISHFRRKACYRCHRPIPEGTVSVATNLQCLLSSHYPSLLGTFLVIELPSGFTSGEIIIFECAIF